MENHGTCQGIISELISDLNFTERYVTDQNNDGESSSGNNYVISENISSEIWNFGRPTFKCRHEIKKRLPARPAPPAFLQEILNGDDMRSKNTEQICGHTIQCLHSHLRKG
jgi:hypothetical protein